MHSLSRHASKSSTGMRWTSAKPSRTFVKFEQNDEKKWYKQSAPSASNYANVKSGIVV